MRERNAKSPNKISHLETSTFETANVDFATYLSYQGLKYLGKRVEYDCDSKRPRALLKFLDEREVAKDLEITFLSSQERRYRELNKHFLREAKQAVGEFMRKAAEMEEN